MNEAGTEIGDLLFGAGELAALLDMLAGEELNPAGARTVLAELFAKGGKPAAIVKKRGLQQVSDPKKLRAWVKAVLDANLDQVTSYKGGNAPVLNWLFGQVVKASQGKAHPGKLRAELEAQLAESES